MVSFLVVESDVKIMKGWLIISVSYLEVARIDLFQNVSEININNINIAHRDLKNKEKNALYF